MNILSTIQLAIQYGPAIQSILSEAGSNDTVTNKLKALAPEAGQLLQTLGAELFPSAAPTLHIVGGAIAAFDPDKTKWLQGSINALGYTPPLVVDGGYGPKTKAGVEWLQNKLGLKVDGLAGQITQAAIAAALGKAPSPGVAAPPTAPAA